MASRPRQKKAAPRRITRKPRLQSNRKTPALPPIPPPVSVQAPQLSRIKMWKWIAYLLTSVTYLWPLFNHPGGNLINFEAAVPKQDKFFNDFLLLVENGEEDQALALCSPSVREDEKLIMDKIIPSFKEIGAFQDSHLVSITGTSKDESWEMIYYLDYEKGAGLAEFKIYKWDQKFVVEKFTVHPMNQSFDQSCEFPSLLDIDIYKLFFMLLGYLMIMLNAKILVECCYSPLKPKWAWIPFILIGFGAISFYLDPGAGMNLDLFSAHVPIAQITKNPFWEPWRVTLTLPLGMLVFFYRNRNSKNPLE